MAARFWVNGGVNSNWGTIGNWSTTSGGAGGAAVPLATDDVTFDGGGNVACLTQNAQRVCLSLTVAAGYTNSITFSASGGINVSGHITFAHSGFTIVDSGTSLGLKMIATGTWTSNGKTVNVPVVIGAAVSFTCTLADALAISNDLTLSNTTSTTFSGAFGISATSATISGSQTVTLSGDVTINGLTTISTGTPDVIDGTSLKWKTQGLSIATGIQVSGTATIAFIGTGTWQIAAGTATLANNVSIEAGAGTLTISATIPYLTGTITYTSGTVTATGSTLSISAACTLATAGMSWDAITLTAAITLTLNSLLAATTLTVPNTAVTFAGTTGFTIGTLTNVSITASRIWTFAAGKTYTVTTALTTVGGEAGASTRRFSWVSSSPGTAVNFVLGPTASQDVGFLDPTDIDASGGLTIFTYHGTIVTSPNWINAYPGGEEFGGVRFFGYAG